ncbi:hypothetical protein QCN27_15370 [Cereibacter sp. SYSU M97828]|nr:hypothetical protein [Cereibacter flavus]
MTFILHYSLDGVPGQIRGSEQSVMQDFIKVLSDLLPLVHPHRALTQPFNRHQQREIFRAADGLMSIWFSVESARLH